MSGDKVGSDSRSLGPSDRLRRLKEKPFFFQKSEVGRGHSVGVFGGTFDPVHIGHLRTALELREALALDEMRLLPCAVPPHRDAPEVAAQHRLAMLRAAVDAEPGLLADDRELKRQGPSYTIDSLLELRRELGAATAICLCIGMDALLNLATWHRWRELLDYAHIVVAARPGWQAPDGCAVDQLVRDRQSDSAARLRREPCGLIWLAEMTLLPVSATDIRTALAGGRSVRYLLPDLVIDYIRRHQLYGCR